MAFFMETKSCCCGCDLKTGTTILVIIIAILNGLCFYYSVTRYNTGSSSVAIELAIFACCAMAGYSTKKNERMFLIPFMIIIIGIFVVMLILSLLLLLAVLGAGSAWNKVVDASSFSSMLDGDRSHKSGGPDFSSIGPITLFILILCLINIAIFLHFVKVVCSLFVEMGKPNGMILPQMTTASPMSNLYYPTVSPPRYPPIVI